MEISEEEKNEKIKKEREEYQKTREYKYLTGYHGTTHESAEKIIEGEFHQSTRENNWLGNGVYFYKYYSDAAIWKDIDTGKAVEEVIHVVVKVKKNQYLDMEKDDDRLIFEEINSTVKPLPEEEKGKEGKRQCKVMNMIWDRYPMIQVIGGRFAPYRTDETKRTLMDSRMLRREFCLRNNETILQKQIMDSTKI